jgi:hypothetical protein
VLDDFPFFVSAFSGEQARPMQVQVFSHSGMSLKLE